MGKVSWILSPPSGFNRLLLILIFGLVLNMIILNLKVIDLKNALQFLTIQNWLEKVEDSR